MQHWPHFSPAFSKDVSPGFRALGPTSGRWLQVAPSVSLLRWEQGCLPRGTTPPTPFHTRLIYALRFGVPAPRQEDVSCRSGRQGHSERSPIARGCASRPRPARGGATWLPPCASQATAFLGTPPPSTTLSRLQVQGEGGLCTPCRPTGPPEPCTCQTRRY